MKINGLLQIEDVLPNLEADSKEQVLLELAARAEERHHSIGRDRVFQVLLERERLGSTGVGDGVAIPHGKMKGLESALILFGRSIDGVDFNALDGKRSHFFFLLIAPEDAFALHIKLLGRISRLMKDPAVRKGILEAADAATIHSIIQEQDNRY